MDVLLHNKPQKLRNLRKAKQNFCNADTDVNVDTNVDIPKWSRETKVRYLGTKIQV